MHLFMTARIVSAIFTPFMVPFVAFLPAFLFYLSEHHAPAIQTDSSERWYIALPFCSRCWASIFFRKSTAGHSRELGQPRETLSPLRIDHMSYTWLLSDDVPDSPSTLYERNHHSHPDLHGHLHQINFTTGKSAHTWPAAA